MPFIQRNSISSFFTTSPFIISFLIGCLYIAMRLWRLNDYGLWLDEVFSVNMARLDWKEILPAVAHDIVHPPLFYLLLKMWIHMGGESLFWLRFFPALTAIATIIPFFSICRELRLSTAEINTAFILISVNSYLIYYAQESRMYSLLLFFTLCSMYLFIRIIIGNGTSKILLPSLFIVNLLLIYTHYFGWLIVGVECIYILILRSRQRLSFVIIIAALAVCFAPWAYMVGYVAAEKQGLSENISWIGRPRLYNLTWYYAALHGTFDVRKLPALSLVFFTYPFLL
jgi:mannosyltransferase